ncbi:MAG: FecR family protein [Proteobacteria bacterium]|nr:FecR family protein [Pseudomonadota bacterium]
MSEIERDALEDLLRQAEPRPVPAPGDLASAREAVRDEWLAVTGRRKARRRATGFAIAATLVIGVFAAINVLRMPAVGVVRVATIEKRFGSVYLLVEQDELRPTDDLANVMSAQTIVTGDDAGLALAWDGGGSLRVDGNTRLRFENERDVLLEHGRIYYDSKDSLVAGTDAGGVPQFRVLTGYGEIRHVGTQYMTQSNADGLVVSVREGRVAIDGIYHDRTVAAGEQATLVGRQQPSVLGIDRSGPAWDWIERTTPAADVDGRTLHEFLVWVSRELGLGLRFEGDAETIAHDAILRGRIDAGPSEALGLRVATAALSWRIEEGVVYISN